MWKIDVNSVSRSTNVEDRLRLTVSQRQQMWKTTAVNSAWEATDVEDCQLTVHQI